MAEELDEGPSCRCRWPTRRSEEWVGLIGDGDVADVFVTCRSALAVLGVAVGVLLPAFFFFRQSLDS